MSNWPLWLLRDCRRDHAPGAVARSVVASLTLLAAASAGAAESRGGSELVLTENEAVRLALRNNRTLLAARLGREVQRFSLAVSEDRYRPRASIDGALRADRWGDTATEFTLGPTLRIPTGGTFSLQWARPPNDDSRGGMGTFAFSQPLLKGFGTGVDTAPVRLARLDERRNVLLLRDVTADIVVSAVGAYRSLIRADQSVAIDRESLARARRQLDVNRALIRSGRMAEQEIVLAEAEAANRALALAQSEAGLTRANAGLLSVLDIDDDVSLRPVRQLPAVEPASPSFERSLDTALENRNDHGRAQIEVAAAEIRLRVAKSDRLWDFTLHATVSEGREGERDYGAGLGLAIPIGDRAPGLAAMTARNDLQDARIALAELRQSIRIAVRQGILEVETALRRVELARRARDLAEQAVAIEQEKLSLGLTSTFQLTAVEDALVRARTGELDAVIAYANAGTQLDWTLGTTLATWEVDLDGLERVGFDDIDGG